MTLRRFSLGIASAVLTIFIALSLVVIARTIKGHGAEAFAVATKD